ncbi:MAG: type II toxin-antitoxin system VapC family toxin [Pseudomonadota bacterium]|uniref:type II toxin-antitoxin system VapC family toxin n=1 Tax=Sulfuricystis thermophila TaxID=2496847 RepID=UPI001035B722|nr:type II toxin-antitoxin system VapC family toxin [Sulfuricystis thermophila]MDI6749185.1 type II toxin-antitoxin system VapC family toxin [Rhodocyclaceae bacterium]
MIGLDTNVLARYYIADAADAEAQRQRELARQLIESGQPLMVCKTVLLEFEWLMRGYYGFKTAQTLAVMEHLCALPNVTIEDREAVLQAVAHCRAGLDFADALHHASYRDCRRMSSFDDRKFARRAKRLGFMPPVVVPR